MKYLILISSLLFFLIQGKRMVYIQGNEYANLIFDEKSNYVNLYIDPTVIRDEKLRSGIKLYIASFFVSNKDALRRKFLKQQHISISTFASTNKKDISEVIYYLEHVDHGNLPLHFGSDAYNLFEIKELKPHIDFKKKLLFKKGMVLIHISSDDSSTELEGVENRDKL